MLVQVEAELRNTRTQTDNKQEEMQSEYKRK